MSLVYVTATVTIVIRRDARDALRVTRDPRELGFDSLLIR